MKNITLALALLIGFLSYGQKDNGTITLLDGSVLTGLVKATSSSFKFKANKNDKAVKYDHATATSATVTNKDNEVLKYEFVYVDYQEKPLLLTVLREGFLTLYGEFSTHFYAGGMGMGVGIGGGMGMGMGGSSSTYHIKRATDKMGQYYIAYGYIPKVGFKKVIKSYFTDCPQLQEKVEKGEFKKDDFEAIVLFYNDHCAPK